MLPIETFMNLKIEDFKVINDTVCYTYNSVEYFTSKENLQCAINEVYYWQYCKGSNFGAMLCDLIAKADNINRMKLHKAFPDDVCAYTLWFYKECGDVKFDNDDDFFKGMKNLLV